MVLSVTAGRSGPQAAKQPQTIKLPPPCLTVDMMCCFWNAVTFTPDVPGHMPSKKFQLLCHQSTEYFPESPGFHQHVLLAFRSSVVLVLERCNIFVRHVLFEWSLDLRSLAVIKPGCGQRNYTQLSKNGHLPQLLHDLTMEGNYFFTSP